MAKARLIGINHVALEVGDIEAAGFELAGGRGLNLRDPWGNFIQIVDYSEVQFERTPGVRRKLGIEAIQKTESARAEIEERGLG